MSMCEIELFHEEEVRLFKASISKNFWHNHSTIMLTVLNYHKITKIQVFLSKVFDEIVFRSIYAIFTLFIEYPRKLHMKSKQFWLGDGDFYRIQHWNYLRCVQQLCKFNNEGSYSDCSVACKAIYTLWILSKVILESSKL